MLHSTHCNCSNPLLLVTGPAQIGAVTHQPTHQNLLYVAWHTAHSGSLLACLLRCCVASVLYCNSHSKQPSVPCCLLACCTVVQASVVAHGWSYCRIDGSMASTDARQAEVEKFQALGSKIPVFLLTTQVWGSSICVS